ncbi:MAG TPA: ABC transporter substrate-binding protein [Solirubrobacteraceae bacterium]|nr:ABC transporter substrate-binding protein [Solirubrobacteraceae bacterium]
MSSGRPRVWGAAVLGRAAHFGRRRLATAALVAGASLAIAACGSSGSSSSASSSAKSTTSASANNANQTEAALGTVLYGQLPPQGTPQSGGTITQGQLTGQTPTYIMPIAPGANTSTGTVSLLSEIYMPLYAGPTGARPVVDYALSAAAGPPVPSDGDKTYTVTLKSGLKWGNGTPVTSKDLLFWYYILRAAVTESPANWGQYVPGEFPLNVVKATAPTPTTVVFHLNKAYNPGFFLNNQLADTNNTYLMPSTLWNIDKTGGPHLNDWTNPAVAKKIYDYLNKQGSTVATFGTNPLWKDGNGPFTIKSFNPTNSSYVLVPNPNYGGSPKPVFSQLDVNTYTGFTSELNALRAGSLDIMVGLDPSQLAEAPALKQQGIYVFGGPGWGWFGGIINFKDKTNDFDNVIAQQYVRAAIDHLIDQPAIIKGVYKGAAVTAYGPVPSAPLSPYAPPDATNPPYPFDPAAAVALLKSHGWKVVPGGQTTCQKPGTGPGECGAGIPAGTPISFVWANQPESVSTTGALESEAVASEAKQAAGITITLQTKTFNFLTSNYNDQNPAAAKYTNDWGVNNYGGLFMDYYPTMDGVFNPGGGFNLGDYNDPIANKLIDTSVFGGDPKAVIAEASYLTKSLPVFFMPDGDYLLAVSNKVGGPPEGWTAMTQQQWFPQYWWLNKQG